LDEKERERPFEISRPTPRRRLPTTLLKKDFDFDDVCCSRRQWKTTNGKRERRERDERDERDD
jgi:hypothetical protein